MSRRRRRLIEMGPTVTRIEGLSLWLDAADTSTITESSGSVSVWADKSGNGYNVVQATGGNQPITGATSQNNKNVIDFNGNSFVCTSASIATTSSNTTFVVYQSTNSFPIGGTDVDILFRHENLGGSDYTLTASNGFIDTTEPELRRENGGTVSLFVNGQAGGGSANQTNTFYIGRADASSAPAYSGQYCIGATLSGSFGHVGSIAEILIYNRSLTPSEVSTIELYLGAKWGITLA